MKRRSGLTRHSLLRFVVTVYLAQLFLPLVFKNLPMPFSSAHFYTVLLLSSFLVMSPGTFLSKHLGYLYLFISIYVVFILLIWYQRTDIKSFILAYDNLLIAMLVFHHYTSRKDYVTLGKICLAGMIFAVIGLTASIVVMLIYPRAMNISVGTEIRGSKDLAAYYQRLGFLGYGFFNGLASFFAIFIYMIKKDKGSRMSKLRWVIFMLLAFFGITRSQTTAFLLFAIVFGVTAWFMGKNYKRDVYRIAALMILVIMIPNTFIADLFYKSSALFPESKIGLRLADAGKTIEDPYIDYYESTEHTGRRLGRIPLLWQSFLSKPLTGGGFFTGHVAWLDMLSKYGLLGFLPWMLLVLNNIKRNMKVIPIEYTPYYLLSVISYIAMGFLKGTGGSHVFMFWFLLVPGASFIYINKEPQWASFSSLR